jgi:tetratricopeptide (TPR) repeat protein
MSDATQAAQLLKQGIAAAKAGRKKEARQALIQVTELDERNEQAWLWLSGVVESLEDRRICLENVLDINPDNASAQAGLRWLDQHAPPPSAAEDQCPYCQAPVPLSGTTCPNCQRPLIVACPACKQYVDVRDISCPNCGQELGHYREGISYHLALAEAYLAHNRHGLAERALARAEEEGSDEPETLARVAALHEEMGHADQAIAAYERAIKGDPENGLLYARLGALYRAQAKPDEARAMYEQAAMRIGDDPEILFELARFRLEQDGATREVLKSLEQIVNLDPDNAEAYLLLGEISLELRRRKQARRYFERAVELTSPNTDLGREARHKSAVAGMSARQQAEASWTGPVRPAYSRSRERPGCLTVYAVLLAIGAVLTALGAVLTGVSLIAGSDLATNRYLTGFTGGGALIMWGTIAGLLVGSALNLVIAIGLWRLKNWARIVIIVLQSLGWMAGACNTVISIGAIAEVFASEGFEWLSAGLLCGPLIGLALSGYIIFWFIVNGDLFD